MPALVSAAYPTRRAAALAGVPVSTLNYWVRTGLLVPSVSRKRERRWSHTDLLVVRLVDWLRRDKDDLTLPRAHLATIRQELGKAERIGERLSDEDTVVWVDHSGRLHFGRSGRMWIELGEDVAQDSLATPVNLVRPPVWQEGSKGPDLWQPRPTLEIVPGKLSGEPHVARTRIPTEAIWALDRRGLDVGEIIGLYPFLSEPNVQEAVDLERQLAAAA